MIFHCVFLIAAMSATALADWQSMNCSCPKVCGCFTNMTKGVQVPTDAEMQAMMKNMSDKVTKCRATAGMPAMNVNITKVRGCVEKIMKPHFPCPCFDDAMTAAKYIYKQHQCNGMGDNEEASEGGEPEPENSQENHAFHNSTHPKAIIFNHSSNGTAPVQTSHSSQPASPLGVAPGTHSSQSSMVVAPVPMSHSSQTSGVSNSIQTSHSSQSSNGAAAPNHSSQTPEGTTADQKKKFMQCMLGDKKPTTAAHCNSPKQSCFNRDFCPGMPDKSHPMSDADKQKFRDMATKFHDDMMSCVKG